MKELMDLIQKVLTLSQAESVRGMKKFLNVLLEVERDHYLNRGSYERKVTDISDYRNGYKSRTLQTRFGKLKFVNSKNKLIQCRCKMVSVLKKCP